MSSSYRDTDLTTSRQFPPVDNEQPSTSRQSHLSSRDSASSSMPEHGGNKVEDSEGERKTSTQPQLSESGIASKIHGLKRSSREDVYQLKHLMLILRRIWKRDYPFRLRTEINAAEKFDDLVLHYRDNTRGQVHRFMQVKHKLDGIGKITASELLDTEDGDFSLVKYFRSWREIRKQPDFDGSKLTNFILCTNIGLDRDGLEKGGIYVSKVKEPDEFLEVTNRENQPPRYKLWAEKSSRLYDFLKTASNVVTNTEISDFLDDFILAVDQSHKKELNRMIKQEIGADSQFNLLDADLIRDSFQSRMLDWFKETGKHSEFLVNKDAEKFFDDFEIKLSCVIAMGLSLEYPEVLRQFGIEFEKENETLERFLTDSNENSNQILELISPKPLLTALRVHQTIKRLKRFEKNDSFIFIHLKKLLLPKIMYRVLSAFELHSNHELLVVDCGSISESHCVKKLWNLFSDITMENTGKKIILITQQTNGATVQLKVGHEVYHETEADISIDNLKEKSQRELLEKMTVEFQGYRHRTNFSRLLGIHNLDNSKPIEYRKLGRVIDSDTLVKIIHDGGIRIGNEVQGLGHIEDYYITRKIFYHPVKKDILKDRRLSDIFAVSGCMAEDELEEAVVNIHYLKHGTENAQFKTLCEQNPDCNIHWLEDQRGELIWIQSSGDITTLLEFKDMYCTTPLEEEQLFDRHRQNRIVIISDVAGGGKSTILASLAQKIKDKDSSLLVIRIDLTQHTSILAKERASRTFSSNDTKAAVEFLVDKLIRLEDDLDSDIYKTMFENKDKAVLLLDGFDEISSTYGSVVIDLLLALKNLNIRKLFVTTRPHTCEVLETKLGAFSHTLQPFSTGDRIKFLTQFWTQRLNRSGCNIPTEEELQIHAKSVMNLLADSSINPEMSRFMGIPLQTRMVAEMYQYKVTGCGDSFSKPKVPRTINISKLYEKFVDEKYWIYCMDKKNSAATTPGEAKDSKITYHERFSMLHKKLALEALFDKNTVELLLSTQPKLLGAYESFCNKNAGEEPTGIIITRPKEGKPEFVHLTFAEYFAAVFLVDTLTEGGCVQRVQDFLLRKLFVESQYKTIRAFINCPLSGGTYAENNKPWKLDLRQYCNANQETVYHIAAKEGNINIVKFFLNRLSKHSEQKSSPPNIDLEDKSGWTPLANAVNNADKYSSSHSRNTAENRYLAMVQCLVEAGANVNWTCPNGETPLHIAAAKEEGLSLDVAKYLIDNGADVHSKDENGRTPLYRAAEYGNTRIIDYLVEHAAVVDAQDIRGLTPLYAAAYAGSETVIKCLQRNGANCNFEINGQCTLLCKAIKDNDYRTVKRLVSNGADVNFSTKDGIAPLDCARHYDIAVYLVGKGAVSENPFLRLCRRVIRDVRAEYPDFEYDDDSSSSSSSSS